MQSIKHKKEELAAYLQNRSQEISADILAKAAAIIDEVRKDKDNALKNILNSSIRSALMISRSQKKSLKKRLQKPMLILSRL